MLLKLQLMVSALILTASAFAGSIAVNNIEWTLNDAASANADAREQITATLNAALFLNAAPDAGAVEMLGAADEPDSDGADLKTSLTTDMGGFMDFASLNLRMEEAASPDGGGLQPDADPAASKTTQAIPGSTGSAGNDVPRADTGTSEMDEAGASQAQIADAPGGQALMAIYAGLALLVTIGLIGLGWSLANADRPAMR